jgi:phosphomannomutase
MFGGEESGGLSIFGHVPEKDGILAGLLAVEMLAVTGKDIPTLSADCSAQYGDMVSARLDLATSQSAKAAVLEKLSDIGPRQIAGLRVSNSSYQDGLKIELEDGSWALIRASGTEPIFRVYVETFSDTMLKNIQKEVLEKLEL